MEFKGQVGYGLAHWNTLIDTSTTAIDEQDNKNPRSMPDWLNTSIGTIKSNYTKNPRPKNYRFANQLMPLVEKLFKKTFKLDPNRYHLSSVNWKLGLKFRPTFHDIVINVVNDAYSIFLRKTLTV